MLRKDKTGLVVIDVQGKLATIVHDSEAFIANLVTLVKAAKLLGMPILWLEQNPEKLGATVPELREVLDRVEPIAKYSFSACGEPAFVEAVKKAKMNSWLITGIEAHICVYQSALGLLDLGYDVELVSDCVSSRTIENKGMALAKLARKGAEVTSLEMCLFELIGDCRADEFRAALSLIK
ncbi:hydrolase [Marinomonas foliarum]|jgi:nicotinamidase-related amidase|uniref:Hydrolase n=1 Tax=Marinomonas foliarum TaxID=491950 RepID=A0A368ZU79_9GAMM|nr:hydrolase [Marinomonas foliarum]QRV24541.1 hydrolase [Marinomonas foliarum]RCX00540.1 nicotinamidase-related amidase [Marinomonas foliarum]